MYSFHLFCHNYIRFLGRACPFQPCENGGTCVSSGRSSYCYCRPGYQGTTCSIRSGEGHQCQFHSHLDHIVEKHLLHHIQKLKFVFLCYDLSFVYRLEFQSVSGWSMCSDCVVVLLCFVFSFFVCHSQFHSKR